MDAIIAQEPRARRFTLPGRDGEMAALEFGTADRPIDILFCHANGFNAGTYRSILAPLGQSLRVLAIDMRGHGASTLAAEPEGREGWGDFADDLAALLTHLNGPPLVLSGHSMGGATSLLAEVQVPDRVRRIVLFDPVIIPRSAVPGPDAPPMSESPLAQGARRRRAVFADRAAVLAAYTGRGAFASWSGTQLADYVAAGFKDREDGQVELACAPAWEAANFSSPDPGGVAAFAAGTAPVRVLRAEFGSTCRVDGLEDELVATGRVTFETVAGASHFLPMERPELVRETLADAAAAD